MKEEKNKITANDLRRELFRGNYGFIILGILSAFLITGCELFLQWMIKQLIDLLSGIPGSFALQELFAMLLGLFAGIILVRMINYIARPRLLSRSMKQYTDFAFRRLSAKNISAFTGENSSSYISALSNDINVIQTNYVETIDTVVQNCFSFIGALTMMFFYSPLLTVVALVLTSLPVLATLATANRLAEHEEALSHKNAAFLATIKDAVSGFSVIKSFKAEKEIAGIVEESSLQVCRTKANKIKQEQVIRAIGSMAAVVAQLGVLFTGAFLVHLGYDLSPGTIIVLTFLMRFVITPIDVLTPTLAQRKAAKALMNKLADLINENISEAGKAIPSHLKQGIRLNNVSFAYNEGENVLSNVSCCFDVGKSYAIVGASGSGKSTLLHLLMQGYSEYRGEILFDQDELRTINTASLYDIISIIQQNVFVFNRSILDNITMLKHFEATEIEAALEQSGLTSFIEEKGEDYLCGENGSALSGGEKQRISIARSLLHKTPVLLVDEATSSLDTRTARHIAESILGLKDLTRIVVTHQLDEDILNCYDEILVLKNGTIREKGTFAGLMAQKGYFYSLYSVSH